MTHAPTHMNNPKITRTPLPAILAGLFILAGCGGSALQIPVIATESTDVANKTDTTVPVAGFLNVGEEPPVGTAKSSAKSSAKSADSTTAPPANTPIVQVPKQVQVVKQRPAPVPVVPTPNSQEQEQAQEQLPPPVFAVAPALPPQRSFSQSPPEPQTSTESVTRSDATGQSHASDSVITFADWVDSFGIVLPTQAQTKTITITATPTFPRDRGITIARNAQGEVLAKTGGGVLTYTDQVLKADGMNHAEGDPIIFTTTTKLTIPAPPTGRERSRAYDANGNEIPDLRASSSNYDVGSDINILKRVTLTQSERDYITENAMFTSKVSAKNPSTTRTETAGVKNQFLQGVGSGLDEGPAGVVLSRGGLDLATSTFGGRRLGGDAADGVGFFRGFTTENPHYAVREAKYDTVEHYNYAGIYSNTNLGAPVSGTSTALWNGRLRTIGYFQFDTDFTLEVTFGDNNTGTLSLDEDELLNPKNTNQFLQIIDATYDVNGVISGTILIDENHDNQNIQAQYGFLTGLIGEQGAVAAFLSSRENLGGVTTGAVGTKENIRNGFDRFGFAGGFVAHPTAIAAPTAPPNLNVRIDAWTDTFTNALPSNVKRFSPPTQKTDSKDSEEVIPNNAFLRREDVRTANQWKRPEGGLVSLNIRSLTLNATGGLDFFPADITIIGVRDTGYKTRTQRHYYAGIHSNTDLGAALPHRQDFNGDAMAEWDGKYSLVQGTKPRVDWNLDFKLTVNFMDASISADILEGTEANNTGKHFYLSGNYDTDGVITGNVIYGVRTITNPGTAEEAITRESPNGILTGLIGQEGAVGVFVSNDGSTNKNTIAGGAGNTGYAGGFVASP